jgi:hypothetical protein
MGFKQSGKVADCEANRLKARAMLVPVTVMADGNVTVTEEAGTLLL